MAILRIDRLEQVTAELLEGLDQLDVWAALPRQLVAPLMLAKRFGRLDLPALALAEVRSSVERLPSEARSDPARADRLAAWLVHIVAWLTDQTDAPPPRFPELAPATSPPGSGGAIASPSSGAPDPASPS